MECAVSPSGFVNLCEVGKDFTFFDFLYEKDKIPWEIEGKIWDLKDFRVWLGIIWLGAGDVYWSLLM